MCLRILSTFPDSFDVGKEIGVCTLNTEIVEVFSGHGIGLQSMDRVCPKEALILVYAVYLQHLH